jgi:hypothetical protein
MTHDEQNNVQHLKAQLDQMRTELDDALAALWSLKRRGYLQKAERFPSIRGRLADVGRIDSQDNLTERA